MAYLHRPPSTWDQDLETLNNTKFYLVSRKGPTLFLLRADNDPTETIYKCCIGSPHQRCSCGGGDAKGKLCLHLMFVMIKILRVPATNPLAWQLLLGEEDVDNILSGRHRPANQQKKSSRHAFLKKGDGAKNKTTSKSENETSNEAGKQIENSDEGTQSVTRRELDENDICSICQDEMTDLESLDELLCYCQSGCGSNFHKKCFRMLAAHTKSERKVVQCPLCRAPWKDVALTTAQNTKDKGRSHLKGRTLPSLRCKTCRMTIRNKFVRCVVCPSLDLCQHCFDGGKVSASYHDHTHPMVMAGTNQYPPQWTAVVPNGRFDGSRRATMLMSELQHREFSPSDYNELLALDASNAPPLYEHLTNALPEVPSSSSKCVYCSLSLSVDRTARQFPCPKKHMVHRSCSVSVLLSALSSSECEGCIAGSIICPFCPVDTDENGGILFPSLRREPVPIRPAAKQDASEGKAACCDIAKLAAAQSKRSTEGRKFSPPARSSCDLSIVGFNLMPVKTNSNSTSSHRRSKNEIDSKKTKLLMRNRRTSTDQHKRHHSQTSAAAPESFPVDNAILSGRSVMNRHIAQPGNRVTPVATQNSRMRMQERRRQHHIHKRSSFPSNNERIRDRECDSVHSLSLQVTRLLR